jgi:hypothetical protein
VADKVLLKDMVDGFTVWLKKSKLMEMVDGFTV